MNFGCGTSPLVAVDTLCSPLNSILVDDTRALFDERVTRMFGDSLEETYLLGYFLSLLAWGRMAGETSRNLGRPAQQARMFLTILGGPEDALKTLEQLVESAPGIPRTLSGPVILDELTSFRSRMIDSINPHLSGDQFAAIRLGFNNGIALGLSAVAFQSVEELKPPLLRILADLVTDARILRLRLTEVEEIFKLAKGAVHALDFTLLHSQLRRLSVEVPPDLKKRKLWDAVFEPKTDTPVSPGNLLAVIPEDYEMPTWGGWSPVFSYVGDQVAYRAIHNGEMFVVVGGLRGPGFASVDEYLALSPDGRTVAYVAHTLLGETYLVYGNETIGPPDYDSVGQPIFSKKSERFAFVARRDQGEFVVVDGKGGPAFDRVSWPTFSDDGRQFAYCAAKGLKEFMVVNGEKGPAFDKVSFPTFSPDGTKVAHRAMSADRYLIVVNGKPLKEVPAERRDEELLVTTGHPVFTANGSKVAFDVYSRGKWRVLVGDDEGEEYDGIAFVTGAVTDHIAYVASKGDKFFLVRDGVQGREIYPGLSEMVFSPDGQTLAIVEGSVLAGKWHVVVNGTTGPSFERIKQLTFSPDGKTIGYGVRDGREFWWRTLTVG